MFYCNRVVVRAPGKVNLSLDITGTTNDGYHTLDTIMQTIDLSDVVVVGKRADDTIRVTCSNPNVPEDDTNIAHKAAKIFFAQTGLPVQGIAIHIDKTIPVQAGLAGGSTDAAAVLCGLNRLYETDLTQEQLCEMGRLVGADVPFCITGGCKLAQGIGDVFTELSALPDCAIAIAKPPKGVDTRYAFKLYDEYAGQLGRPDTVSMIEAINSGSLEAIGRHMFNVFEQVGNLQEVELLKGVLTYAGAYGAVMSGSGSAVIGLFAEEKDAKKCLKQLKDAAGEAYLTKPCPNGAELIHAS
ncbi:4-(cytidine 5'-diphospho)-2-C-methyl-D-erythritol kinase [Ruminococcaceae bacterium OttesenSCG-928-L11]|nr:4-(cytidine 5'-diphospho)-2-C-methyl-D-erythritol kinase [Ruminococcaceae bacterium OttesenSCG-928-L11]